MLKYLPILLSAAVTVWCCSALAAQAADTKPPVAPPIPVVNSVTQAMVTSGVLSCASRVNQVANFLTTGSHGSGAVLLVPQTAPDQQLVSVSLELPDAAGPSAYSSATFAPGQANGCGAVYETVLWWPKTCDDVAARHFGNLKRMGSLAKNVATLDGGPLVRIFLLPAGTGCVTIKKEVVN